MEGRIQQSSYVKFNGENINRSQQAQLFLCQNYCKKQDFQLSNIWCLWLKKVQDPIGSNKSFLMQQFMEQLTE